MKTVKFARLSKLALVAALTVATLAGSVSSRAHAATAQNFTVLAGTDTPYGVSVMAFAPISSNPVTSGIDGASRMSSVSGLKVRPSTATVLPRRLPPTAPDTLRAIAGGEAHIAALPPSEDIESA